MDVSYFNSPFLAALFEKMENDYPYLENVYLITLSRLWGHFTQIHSRHDRNKLI